MTMTEIRKAFQEKIRFSTFANPELVSYYRELRDTLEELWKNGNVSDFSDDFLRLANGYQINSGDYENIHILQTLDLRSVTASKTGVKALGEFIVR